MTAVEAHRLIKNKGSEVKRGPYGWQVFIRDLPGGAQRNATPAPYLDETQALNHALRILAHLPD